ncbi:hypothetical protein [Kineococcus sp. SYSU DK005]|uniref:hypothetical protein n=1 Tax=Kineococcus sp. SYSU DK005 TaxID=3383126 RepID=UPI003D7CD4A1
MTPEPERPAGTAAQAPEHGLRVLAEAASALRVHTPTGWRAVRDDLLARARRAHRPSAPVRGRHALGEYLVACDVVVGELREAVDGVAGATAVGIACATSAEDLLERVTVEVSVVFGEHLPTTARAVRDAVGARLADLLGDLSPGAAGVDVHVHVGDVVVDAAGLGRSPRDGA